MAWKALRPRDMTLEVGSAPEPASRPGRSRKALALAVAGAAALVETAPRPPWRMPLQRGENAMFVVAGVSGHVGSVVAKELLAAGEKVKVLVRDAGKGASWSKAGAEVAVASLEDPGALTTALK